MARPLKAPLKTAELDPCVEMKSVQELKRQLGAYVNSPEISDVSFVVGEQEQIMYGHRFIIAARSDAFKAMLHGNMKEGYAKVIRLPNLSPDVFLVMLHYLYTSNTSFKFKTIEFVLDVMKASDMYQLEPLKLQSVIYLKPLLQEHNVCTLYGAAEMYNVPELRDCCQSYIFKHASSCFQSNGFLELSKSNLIPLLKSDSLAMAEVDIFKAVICWGNNQVKLYKRSLAEELRELIPYIRFPVMTGFELMDIVEPVGIVPEKTLLDAYRYHSTQRIPNKNYEIYYPRVCVVKRRKFVYSYDFDEDGILYWIGTEGRQKIWTNPCDAGRVRVSSSHHWEGSPISAVVGRVARGESYISDKNKAGSWVAIDLGESKRACVTTYTLRHGLQRHDYFMRNWQFQGSNDSVEWITLRDHVNDCSHSSERTTASWKISSPYHNGFRHFRIVVTGPDSKGCYTLVVGGLELYGILIDLARVHPKGLLPTS